jgi:hypothetical protein
MIVEYDLGCLQGPFQWRHKHNLNIIHVPQFVTGFLGLFPAQFGEPCVYKLQLKLELLLCLLTMDIFNSEPFGELDQVAVVLGLPVPDRVAGQSSLLAKPAHRSFSEASEHLQY